MREQKIHLTSYFNPHFITDEMLTFYHALKDYGFNHVHFEPCTIDPDAINILFCGFNLGHDLQKSLRLDRPIDRIIVRNLEPAFPTGPCMFPSYFNLMKNNPVWDYAAGNIARLQAAGIDQIEYVPVTYMPVLERIPTTVEQDIDVYFYGYLSPRRQHIVDQLIARGLKVHVNEFGSSAAYSDLDRLIARSKVILNMTNYDQYHIFEIVRAALPLANHKVVSQNSIAIVRLMMILKTLFYIALMISWSTSVSAWSQIQNSVCSMRNKVMTSSKNAQEHR